MQRPTSLLLRIAPLPLLLALATPALAQPGGGAPPLGPPPVPFANPITAAKVELGRALFWDEQLSSTRSVACGTCHIPGAGSADPRTALGSAATLNPGPDGAFGGDDDVLGSPGVPFNLADGHYDVADGFGLMPQVTGRNAPSAINAAYSPTLFWDGRAGPQFLDPDSGAVLLNFNGALENQALGPLVSNVEMAHDGRELDDVVARIVASEPLALSPAIPLSLAAFIAGRSYPELFADTFGDDAVTAARIGLAIATYERTLIADQTPWDAFAAGAPGALTLLELQGQQVFVGAGCGGCHPAPLFSDNAFHYIGVRPADEDPGRFAVTGNPALLGAMRTPSLRNVELRAPHMHGGQLASLAEVVDFYDRGGDFDAPNKPPVIQPLGMSPQQKNALIAFLGRPLTDPRVSAEAAPFDRPLLASEAGRVPELYGSSTVGSDGMLPRAIAVEPPYHDNPNLTFGVDRGLGGAPAWLAFDIAPSAGLVLKGATSWIAFTPAALLLPLGSLAGDGAGAGHTSVAFTTPLGAGVIGIDLFGQWFLADRGAAGGVSASEGFALTVF